MKAMYVDLEKQMEDKEAQIDILEVARDKFRD